MEKKTLVTAALSGFIFLAVAQFCFVKFTNANPYESFMEHVRVAALAYPSITILSPAENNTLHNSSNLTITFKVTIESGSIDDVYYKPSWQPNNTTVMWYEYFFGGEIKLNLTGVPEGNQTVTITAYGSGSYAGNRYIVPEYPWDPNTESVCYYFDSVSYYTVGFTVDTVPPQVTVLELDNKTFAEPEVPLSFTVNEAVSKIAYALDGKENVTVAGNTTLTGLLDGEHNVTVYATDEAGNIGASETIHFRVGVPFPTSLIIVPIVLVAIVGVALLVYFKKRKH